MKVTASLQPAQEKRNLVDAISFRVETCWNQSVTDLRIQGDPIKACKYVNLSKQFNHMHVVSHASSISCDPVSEINLTKDFSPAQPSCLLELPAQSARP